MNCRICKKKIQKLIFKKIPLVNSFNKNNKLYSNGFSYCSNCDLGFNTKFISDSILYNKNYMYDGKFNPNKIEIFVSLLKNKNNFKILEVGGGNGFVGKLLCKKNKNISYTNLDPSATNGFKTKKKFLQKFVSNRKYDLIICLNVFAHVSKPINLIKAIKKLSHENTQFIFSVQNSLKEIKNGFLDNVYHEHKYYYSPYSFSNFIKNLKSPENNFYKINLHGESILYSNKKLNSKLIMKTNVKKKLFSINNLKSIEKKYKKKLKYINSLISRSKKDVYLIGCAPRSIKLLYDLSKKIIQKINCIYEPKNSKKIGTQLPYIKIKIEIEHIDFKNLNIWMPYHLKKPKLFKKLPSAIV